MRDQNDSWIRVWLKKGGMIVLPAGIYHRFTLDSNNYIKVALHSMLMKHKLVVCLPAKNGNNNTNTTRTIYSIPLCLAIISIMNKMTGWEICSFFPQHALILGNRPKTLCSSTVYCIRVSIIYVSCDYCVFPLHIFYASSLYTV